mgnify:CR=1 FL=1
MTLFQTIQEVIGRINIGKWIDFHRQRRDAYDPIALLTILLFAMPAMAMRPASAGRNESLRSTLPMASSGTDTVL